jgi:phosphoserine phosphatase SerB
MAENPDTFTPKLIVFDVNKTLIRDNSWQELNQAMGVEPEEDDMLMKWGKNGIITDQQGQEILCDIYNKRGQPTREAIESLVYKYTYFEGVKETIKELQSRGYEVALLSGSMDILVEHMAEELGVERYASNNTLEFNEQGVLKYIRTIMNDEDYKVVKLAEWCSELGIRSQEVAVVGDGASDRLLATAAGFVVAFNDDSAVAELADAALGEAEFPKLLDCFSK